MVNAILKAGTPVEFTLTGIAGTVKAIQNDRVLIENAKGETLNSSLSEIEGMLKSGALKVQALLCGVPVGCLMTLPAGRANTNLEIIDVSAYK